jgi:hypothetical protein
MASLADELRPGFRSADPEEKRTVAPSLIEFSRMVAA